MKLLQMLLSKLCMHEKQPTIIRSNIHNIDRSNISKNALQVIDMINQHGYKAYLVGGAVQDLLLGIVPKDFDVVTNAKPERVKELYEIVLLLVKDLD